MGVLSALPGFQWTVHPHKGIVLPTVEAQAPYPATGAALCLLGMGWAAWVHGQDNTPPALMPLQPHSHDACMQMCSHHRCSCSAF